MFVRPKFFHRIRSRSPHPLNMSASRHRLLSDLRVQLRNELAETTATTIAAVFPETSESFNGFKEEDLFQIVGYMEARFYILESLSMIQVLLNRDIRLREIEFILEHGVLPIVTHQDENSARAERDQSRATKMTGFSRILKNAAPLMRNIINDHPRRLNLYAYFFVRACFKGDRQKRLLCLERIIFRLILEKHSESMNSRRCPRIVLWLAFCARDLLSKYPEQLLLTDHFRLRAIIEISERWSRIFGEQAEGIETHFTVFPQLLYRNFTRAHVQQGMLTIGAADIKELCAELHEQILLLMGRIICPVPDLRLKFIGLALRTAQHRARKFINSTERKSEISSVIQLRRDLPLLPPCIYSLIANLQRDNKLSNYDRYNLLVFFKNVGLPMREAEFFLRGIYNRNAAPSETWTTVRAGHLRRVYQNVNRRQLRCANFDRYCVWRRGSDHDAKRMITKIRNGQRDRDKKSGFCCSVGEFQNLLQVLGNVSDVDSARTHCATLGCFKGSEMPFFSPLGYYYNTKGMRVAIVETEDQNDSSSDDSLSW